MNLFDQLLIPSLQRPVQLEIVLSFFLMDIDSAQIRSLGFYSFNYILV